MIFELLLIGFALFSLLYVLLFKRIPESRSHSAKKVNNFACYLFALTGVYLVFLWVFRISMTWQELGVQGLKRLYLPSDSTQLFMLLKSLIVILVMQLFWVKRLHTNRIFRASVAVILLSELFVNWTFIMTWLNPEYIPTSWARSSPITLLLLGTSYLLSLSVVFLFVERSPNIFRESR